RLPSSLAAARSDAVPPQDAEIRVRASSRIADPVQVVQDSVDYCGKTGEEIGECQRMAEVRTRAGCGKGVIRRIQDTFHDRILLKNRLQLRSGLSIQPCFLRQSMHSVYPLEAIHLGCDCQREIHR